MAYDLTTSQQLAPVVVPWILLAVATLFVALRFKSQAMQTRGYRIDDWLVLTALIITYAYQACNTYAISRGAGIPMMTILSTDPLSFVQLVQSIFASNIMWVIPVTVLQLAVLTFYVRLFGVKRWVRYASWTLMGTAVLYAVTFFITQLLSCRPLQKFWDPTTPGHCFDQLAFCASMGLIHVMLDVAIVLLPMPLIWTLQISKRNKWLLTLLLGVGLFTGIASLLKLTCLIDFNFISKTDLTVGIWYSILMQAIEIPIGIICTCIPTLSPVVSAVKKSRFGSQIRLVVSTLSVSSRKSHSSTQVGLDGSKDEKFSSSAISAPKGSWSGSNVTHNCSVEALPRATDEAEFEEQRVVEPTQPNSIYVDRTWDVRR